MVKKKVSAFLEDTDPTADDNVLLVDNLSGIPTNRRTSITNFISKAAAAVATTWTAVQTFSENLVIGSTKGFRPSANTTTWPLVQDASGTAVVTVDTTNSEMVLPTTGTTKGGLRVKNTTTSGEVYIGEKNGISGRYYPYIDMTVSGSQYAFSSLRTWMNASYDAGTEPIFQVESQTFSGAITARPLFSISNYGTKVLLVDKSGRISIGSNVAPSAAADLAASTTSAASLRLRSGVDPTSPNAGDMWFDGTDPQFHDGTTTRSWISKAIANTWTAVQTFSENLIISSTKGIRPSVDTTTWPVVQDASGTAVLTADTTNNRVRVDFLEIGGAGSYLRESSGLILQSSTGTINSGNGASFYLKDGSGSNKIILNHAATYLNTSIAAGHGGSPTAFVDTAPSTTSKSGLRLRSGVAPTTPNAGDMWFDGTNLKFYDGTTTRTINWT